MTDISEGTTTPAATLTEQASGQRLSRAMFIGHTVGYLIMLAIGIGGLGYLGFSQPVSYDAVLALTSPPTVLHFQYVGLAPQATLGLAILGAIIWTDLTVRRRHDRNRSGVDAAIWQMLLLASVIIHSFADAPDIVGYLDAVLVLGGLYLFVVLVLLPGTSGENRYGPLHAPS